MIYYFEEKMRRQDYDTKLFATKAATYFSSESVFNLYPGRSSDSSIFQQPSHVQLANSGFYCWK